MKGKYSQDNANEIEIGAIGGANESWLRFLCLLFRQVISPSLVPLRLLLPLLRNLLRLSFAQFVPLSVGDWNPFLIPAAVRPFGHVRRFEHFLRRKSAFFQFSELPFPLNLFQSGFVALFLLRSCELLRTGLLQGGGIDEFDEGFAICA